MLKCIEGKTLQFVLTQFSVKITLDYLNSISFEAAAQLFFKRILWPGFLFYFEGRRETALYSFHRLEGESFAARLLRSLTFEVAKKKAHWQFEINQKVCLYLYYVVIFGQNLWG